MANKVRMYVRTMIDADLLKELDDYAERMNISRTSAVCVILSSFFQQMNATKTLQTMAEAMRTSTAQEGVTFFPPSTPKK